MTDDKLPPHLTRLTFHGPLSEARATRLAGRLTRTRPATVLDLGCGWGELMLRTLAAVPGALSEAEPPQSTIDAPHALRRLVSPGGRVLLGECFWADPAGA